MAEALCPHEIRHCGRVDRKYKKTVTNFEFSRSRSDTAGMGLVPEITSSTAYRYGPEDILVRPQVGERASSNYGHIQPERPENQLPTKSGEQSQYIALRRSNQTIQLIYRIGLEYC